MLRRVAATMAVLLLVGCGPVGERARPSGPPGQPPKGNASASRLVNKNVISRVDPMVVAAALALAALVTQLGVAVFLWPGSSFRTMVFNRKQYGKLLSALEKYRGDEPTSPKDGPLGASPKRQERTLEKLLERLVMIQAQNHRDLLDRIAGLEKLVVDRLGANALPSDRNKEAISRGSQGGQSPQAGFPSLAISEPEHTPKPAIVLDQRAMKGLEDVTAEYQKAVSGAVAARFNDFVNRNEAIGLAVVAGALRKTQDLSLLLAVPLDSETYALLPGWEIVSQFAVVYGMARAMPAEIQQTFDLHVDRRGVFDLSKAGVGRATPTGMEIVARGRLGGLIS